MIPGVENNRYDLVIASHSITNDRLKVVDMVKYYSNSASFLMQKDRDGSNLSPAAFAGKGIGVQTGTVHAAYLERNFTKSELKFYPSQVEAYADLTAGRIDAVMGDTTSLYSWVQSDGKDCGKISAVTIADKSLGDGGGIILKKGNEPLRSDVEKEIASIRASGQFEKLTAKYFPFPIWTDN
ncbi:transporter substrate-binding domain-containing protein [Agrobacterium tumefaciens]|uniref:transporter substrate-binding domain-containing protein n=1 Tax=Agrobacterium tumefaciens TaxID=358 RepID=UPI0015742CA3|nr:transporter substrate-binding domain-containing protein [Agrobacterium tumefaciens]NTE68269.1 transporter substrate-binding domain-containing protein [Agrobacterium tumefaciens]